MIWRVPVFKVAGSVLFMMLMMLCLFAAAEEFEHRGRFVRDVRAVSWFAGAVGCAYMVTLVVRS